MSAMIPETNALAERLTAAAQLLVEHGADVGVYQPIDGAEPAIEHLGLYLTDPAGYFEHVFALPRHAYARWRERTEDGGPPQCLGRTSRGQQCLLSAADFPDPWSGPEQYVPDSEQDFCEIHKGQATATHRELATADNPAPVEP
jgi:hypothetical protein